MTNVLMPNDQPTASPVGHWALVIDWSLGLGHWSFSALSAVRIARDRPRHRPVLARLRETIGAPVPVAVPVAVRVAARVAGDGAHRHAADRPLEVARLGAVEHHAGQAGADGGEVAQGLLDHRPLLAARDGE